MNKMPLSTKNYDQSYYYGSTAMIVNKKTKKDKGDY